METDLPFIDEHTILVAAPADAVWRSLGTQFRSPATGVLAHLVGAEHRRVTGEPLSTGATLPGFTVAESEPEAHLSLAGKHRFSRYLFDFSLVPEPGGTRLTGRSYGEFPGFLGGIYRLLVIGSGAHPVIVRRLLRAIARRAEQAT